MSSHATAKAPGELRDADRRGAVIVLSDVHKSHGSTVALQGMSLTVPRGAIFALLGPNGCGKTTTLKLLLGMNRPDSGTGTVFGLRMDDELQSVAIRQRTGFVSETKELFQGLDVATTIRLVRAMYPLWDASLERELLQRFALPPKQKVAALSKGMRAKLALLVACCRRAELLILDEPTDGLDPAAAEQMIETLVGMVAESELTVLLSSHQLHEVERVADGLAIMRDGRVVLQGELDELRQRVRRVEVRWKDIDVFADRMAPDDRSDMSHATLDKHVREMLPDATDLLRVIRRDGELTVFLRGDADSVANTFTGRGAEVSVHPVPLRELFLTLTEAHR
ncbi:MAG: ABC transporter ATP-binding protein [Phycisphaerae bacterium]|nr:ABC transporter ATP-binding protein [Gemmatimonadaceae bacterium]